MTTIILFTFFRANPMPTIQKCYEGAKSKNFTFFALQYYGECWLGDENTANTYSDAGFSTECVSGSGKQWTNFVYHIGSSIRKHLYSLISCFVFVACTCVSVCR